MTDPEATSPRDERGDPGELGGVGHDAAGASAGAAASGGAGEDSAAHPPAGLPAAASAPGLGVAEALALVVLFVGAWTLPTLISALVRGTTGHAIPPVWQLLMGQVIGAAVILPVGLRWSGLRWREACPTPPLAARFLPGIVLASIGLSILLGEAASWIPGAQQWREAVGRFATGSTLLPFAISAWVAAPLLEELFCRGVLLRGLIVRHTAAAAILTTAVLWALMHLNPYQGLMALPLGLAYGWLSLRTRSLLPSMVSHAVVNSTGLLVVFPLMLALGYKSWQIRDMAHLPPTIVAAGAVAALAGCTIAWRQFQGGTLEGDDVRTAPVAPRGLGAARLLAAGVATLALVVIAIAATQWAGPARQVSLRSTEAARLAGCYRLELPGSVAARLFPGATPPVEVRLTRRVHLRSIYVVDVLTAAAAGAPVYWVPKPNGDLTIHSEEHAVALLLQRRGGAFVGTARAYQNARSTPLTGAPVSARRITCPRATPQ